MNMKNKLKRSLKKLLTPSTVMISAFLGVLVCPALIWIAMPPEKKDTGAALENRNPAPKPEFVLSSYYEYPAKYDEYFNDHFPFRRILSKYSRKIASEIRPFYHPKVMYGRNGFLFYTPKGLEDTVASYTGTDIWPEDQMMQIVSRIDEWREKFEEMGIDFLLVVAPNKMTVYDEHLSGKHDLRRAPMTRAEQLEKYLSEYAPKVKYIYLEKALRDAKEKTDKVFYYHEDTHWNHLGGYIGFREILKQLNPPADMPSIENAEIVFFRDTVTGDLRTISGLGKPVPRPEYKVALPYEYHGEIVNLSEHIHRRSINPDAPDQRKVWLYRDSFTSAMEDYFAAYFKQVDFYWGIPLRAVQFKKSKPDVVIFEVVERAMSHIEYIDYSNTYMTYEELFQD